MPRWPGNPRLWRAAAVLCVCLTAGLAGGMVRDSQRTFTPTATAQVLVDAQLGLTKDDTLGASVFAYRVLSSIALTTSSGAWAQEAGAEVGLRGLEAADQLSVESIRGSLLLRVIAQGRDPLLTTRLANAGARALADSVNHGFWGASHIIRARPVTLAVGPAPSLPTTPGGGVLRGGIAGAAVGLALCLLLELIDHTVRSRDVGKQVGLPVIAALPDASGATASASAGTGAALAVLGSVPEVPSPTVLLVSADRHPPVSATTVLAQAFVDLGYRTGLVDLEVRARDLTVALASSDKVGVTEIARFHIPADDAVTMLDQQLGLLPAGSPSPIAGLVTQSPAVREAVATMGERFDVVILVAGRPTDDWSIPDWAARADAVVVAAREHRTSRADLRAAVQALRSCRAPVTGVLMVGHGQRRAVQSPPVLAGSVTARS